MKIVNFFKIKDAFVFSLPVSILLNFIFSFLTSIAYAGQISLAWDRNPQPEVVGYKVYYGVSSQKYTDVVDVKNQTTAVITGLTEGTKYYFIVTDYSANMGVESPASNEVSGIVMASTPTPPPPKPAPNPTPAPPAPTPSPTPNPVPNPIPGGETLLTNQMPEILHYSDGNGPSFEYELGMRFMSTKAGIIKAIRFYKDSMESGTHTGKIYSSNGTLLTSVVFTAETVSGWQQQSLTTPLSINANTEYTVSVNTGNTYLVYSPFGMSSKISNGSLFSIVGNNGVYGNLNSMPTKTYQDSNFFRDVVFIAQTTPTPKPIPEPIPEPPPKPIPDTQKPTVRITSPRTGTTVLKSKSILIKASASDDKGIKNVLFYVNNVLKCTVTKAPYTCTITAPRRANRKLTIQVKAEDTSKNIGVSKIITLTTK